MFKLLIADDEVIEREAIKYIIKENYNDVFEVCETSNGRELIEKAKAFMPDIILTDIKMPGMNGLEATTIIKKDLPECRIIIMSAFNYFNFAQEAVTLGAEDFIIKPAPADKIVKTLNKVMQNISENRERKKREEDINLKLKSVTQYLEEELIFLMSTGEIDENAIMEFFELLDIESKAFICVAISFSERNLPGDIGGEVQKRMIKKRLIEKLKEKLLARNIRFFLGAVGQQISLLLLINEEMEEYEARVLWTKTFSEIKDELFNDMLISLNIGIGIQCKLIPMIYSCFLQAKIAMKYDPIPDTVISYGDISIKNTCSEYPLNKERSLIDAFIQGDLKNSLLIMDEIIDWMMVNLLDIENIKQKTYETLLVLVREAAMNLNLMEFGFDSETMRTKLFLFDTTRELRIFTKTYIENKIMELVNIKKTRSNTLLSMIKDYISNNFDKDISLESVADVIRISPFYLSKLFKKEAGNNFIDYLTEFRIRKAKELLSVPTNNVREICYMVGYKDPNYFARVFKKINGITPTEYREKRI